jgi:hypothetical protein
MGNVRRLLKIRWWSALCVQIMSNIQNNRASERNNIRRCMAVRVVFRRCCERYVGMFAKILQMCCNTCIACVEHSKVK